jgi:hypothetical protein
LKFFILLDNFLNSITSPGHLAGLTTESVNV